MLRSAFLKRMAFAALATWFVDLPLLVEPEPESWTIKSFTSIAPDDSHPIMVEGVNHRGKRVREVLTMHGTQPVEIPVRLTHGVTLKVVYPYDGTFTL